MWTISNRDVENRNLSKLLFKGNNGLNSQSGRKQLKKNHRDSNRKCKLIKTRNQHESRLLE